jgi:hypothetical protein
MKADFAALDADDETCGRATPQPEVVWDLRRHAPELAELLRAATPGIDQLQQLLTERLPMPKSRGPFRRAPFIRPLFHDRAYYICLDDLLGSAAKGAVIAVKGSEPYATDLDDWADTLHRSKSYAEAQYGSVSAIAWDIGTVIRRLDGFALLEGKVPCGLGVEDAMQEAEAALAFQLAYARRYGELARLPLPLFVYKWPEEIGDRLWQAIGSKLSKRAAHVVPRMLRAGLGGYAYYFPAIPIRVLHLDWFIGAKDSYAGRMVALTKPFTIVDVELSTDACVTVNRWIELVSRMLAAGYFPKDSASVVTGDCLQSQNATVDGGFCDADSIVAMSGVTDDAEFRYMFRRAIEELSRTIAAFMAGPNVATQRFVSRVPDVFWAVWADIRSRLRDELARNPPADRRLTALVEERAAYRDLDEAFALALDGRKRAQK